MISPLLLIDSLTAVLSLIGCACVAWGCGTWVPLDAQFKQQLTHESDGLIFQAAQDPYVPFTCQQLLKWKVRRPHLPTLDNKSMDGCCGPLPLDGPQLVVGVVQPADMNSVDFFLSAPPGQPPRIAVGGSVSARRLSRGPQLARGPLSHTRVATSPRDDSRSRFAAYGHRLSLLLFP